MLYDRDHDPESHGGVISLFGSEVVVEGDAPREHGRLLNDLSTLRKKADYGYGPVEEDPEELLEDVRSFLEHVESLLDDES